MVIFITGASGFIGQHLVEALLAAGHSVIAAVRRPRGGSGSSPGSRSASGLRETAADFTRDLHPEAWRPRLAGVDVVINAVGIIREQESQSFELLHERAPQALFAACAEAGVKLVLQISALGADDKVQSRYHLSKKAADDYLRGLDVPAIILQPSLVYGPGGTSARLFTTLASLPVLALPRGGVQQVQPVHVDDVCAAVLRLIEASSVLPASPGHARTLAAVGPHPISLAGFLAQLRVAMGMGRAIVLPVPLSLARLGTRAAALLPGSLLDPETLSMLERGNTADAAAFTAVLGHAPRPPAQFIPRADAGPVRLAAQLNWLLPVLRWSVALVWIWTGIVSLGLYPVQQSYELLARTGISGMLAPLMLYGAALLDLGFGIGSIALRPPWRRWLWLAQLALILFYTVIISFRLPEFWLHPYGPLLKNLPMLAAIWMLYEMERK